jgi:hypothetical protein
MSLTKVSYSMIQGAPFNVLDYGAVMNSSSSAATNTSALLAAIAVCQVIQTQEIITAYKEA